MAGRGGKNATKGKGASGYKMPGPIPQGEILTDTSKKQWIIGESIGVGGFGEIYSAASFVRKISDNYTAVVKIEPHGNGPLFVEMHFFIRNAKSHDIDAWKRKRKLSHLGMPKFLGSGSHNYGNTKYRFVVMERYGTDLWKLFLDNGRRFPESTVYKIALQIIDVLEYIHNRTYVHADIKGSNLLLSLKSKNLVYLVDFGMSSHYSMEFEYKHDPKKAHNGTIEYTSRDAHEGVPTMRGDFEILGYNMIQWLCGSLPWEQNLKVPGVVQKQKEKAFENIPKFLNLCFPTSVPMPMIEYMMLVDKLEFDEEPNYNRFRQILFVGLGALRCRLDDDLQFSVNPRNVEKSARKTVTVKFDSKANSKSMATGKNATQIKNDRPKIPELFGLNSTLGHQSFGEGTSKKIDHKKSDTGRESKVNFMDEHESDVEYDTRKTKNYKLRKTKKKPDARMSRLSMRKISDSSDDSDPEFVLTGTRSRPKRSTKRTKGNIVRRTIDWEPMSTDSESDQGRPKRTQKVAKVASEQEYIISDSGSDDGQSETFLKRTNRYALRKPMRMHYMTEDSDFDDDLFQD